MPLVLVAACAILVASRGIFCCDAQTLVVKHRLSTCIMWTSLLHGLWDLSSLTKDQTHIL